ncbi:unnamed protein product, partial [Mesorhabditis spiculigera]
MLKYLLLVSLIGPVAAHYVNITVNGTVFCGTDNPVDLPVELWDDDTVFDDLLFTTQSNRSGYFEMNVTEYVYFYLRPYIYIHHRCKVHMFSDEDCHIETQIMLLDYDEEVNTRVTLGDLDLKTDQRDGIKHEVVCGGLTTPFHSRKRREPMAFSD